MGRGEGDPKHMDLIGMILPSHVEFELDIFERMKKIAGNRKMDPPLPTMFYFLMNTNNYVVVSNIFYFHPLEKMIQFD